MKYIKLRPSIEICKRTIIKEFVVGVEIGVLGGSHSGLILRHWNELKLLYLVDSYAGASPEATQKVKDRFKWAENRIKWIIKPSVEAAKEVENEELDFAYIDANHKYSFVVDDLNAWYPKVKNGGVFCGHDYFTFPHSVKKAVDEWAEQNRRDVFCVDPDWWIFK